ncbi:MAG: hypothetical protein IJU02_07485 [Lachnospiraceae bacterium]|nr:hypothetical protein [Lachnospiraceae bacterium]
MERKIILPSRNANNWLEQVKENSYVLHSELDFVRCGYDKDGSIYFVDPPGGPYLDVGGILENVGAIKSIVHQKGRGFIITFDNDLSSKQEKESF